jgi:uncharacterized protein (DUF1800 family)
MSLEPRRNAAVALHRFGLGPRPNSIAAIASDPQGALVAELDRPAAGKLTGRFVPSDLAARRFEQFRYERRRLVRESVRAQQARSARMAAQDQQPQAMPQSVDDPVAQSGQRRPANVGLALYREEADIRLRAALSAETGLVERLVWFWSNHFCVSGNMKPRVIPLAGSFEREAIRPHVLGRFSDMLLAVESHPAMLIYLDNSRSIGPNSQLGLRRGRGLNENLAREILELHTLGVPPVYSQTDVTNLAKIITGWTYVALDDSERGGQFQFNPRLHEPGPQQVLGKSYPDTGFEQGRAVLQDLARHPATARHIASKLAIHFVADVPPPALVDRLAKRFLDTDGDLKQVTIALLQSPEAWEAKRAKFKRPSEWIVGALRAADGKDYPIESVLNAQRSLGEPLWQPPSPKGFSDRSAVWIDGLAKRLDIASELAAGLKLDAHPSALLDDALGPLASAETRSAIGRAEDRKQAMALLFLAPESLWR